MKKIIFGLIFIFSSCLLFGQQCYYKGRLGSCFEYGLQGGFSQYKGELNGFQSALGIGNFHLAGGFMFRYNFNYDYTHDFLAKLFDQRCSIRLNLLHCNTTAEKDRYNVNGYKLKTSINEISAVMEYSFIRFSSAYNAKEYGLPITPYVFGGFGGFNYTVKDASTNIDINDGSKMAFCGIIGGGAKAALWKGVVVGMDVGLRITSADDLDGKINVGGMKDIYYYFGANVLFNFAQILSE